MESEYQPIPDNDLADTEDRPDQAPLDRLGLMQQIRKRFNSTAARLSLAALSVLGAGAARSESSRDHGAATETVATMEPPAKHLSMRETIGDLLDQGDLKWPGMHQTVLVRNADGQMEFHPWRLLAPLQLEIAREHQVSSEADFTIPYEYSRLFDTGKPLRAEDHDKLVARVDQELKQAFADRIRGLGFRDVTRSNHGEEAADSLTITHIGVTGTTSPEGPKEKGPATLAPGAIDPENISLGFTRAKEGFRLTEERMAALGLTPEALGSAAKELQSEELQFSDAEMKELATIAQLEPGADDLERIYNLVVAYRDKRLENPEVVAKLDTIIASKQSVEVTIQYDANRKDTFVLALPLAALLLIREIYPGRRRRPGQSDRPRQTGIEGGPDLDRNRAENSGQSSAGVIQRPGRAEGQGPDNTNTAIAARHQELEKPMPPVWTGIEVPRHVQNVELPNDPVEFEKMQEQTLAGDLYVYMDNERTVKRGVDYRALADEVGQHWDEVPEADREQILTMRILQRWEEHDLNLKEEAGLSLEGLKMGLGYDRDPAKVQWARMHARELLALVAEKRALPDDQQQSTDYVDLLAPKVRRMLQRRTLRETKQ